MLVSKPVRFLDDSRARTWQPEKGSLPQALATPEPQNRAMRRRRGRLQRNLEAALAQEGSGVAQGGTASAGDCACTGEAGQDGAELRRLESHVWHAKRFVMVPRCDIMLRGCLYATHHLLEPSCTASKSQDSLLPRGAGTDAVRQASLRCHALWLVLMRATALHRQAALLHGMLAPVWLVWMRATALHRQAAVLHGMLAPVWLVWMRATALHRQAAVLHGMLAPVWLVWMRATALHSLAAVPNGMLTPVCHICAARQVGPCPGGGPAGAGARQPRGAGGAPRRRSAARRLVLAARAAGGRAAGAARCTGSALVRPCAEPPLQEQLYGLLCSATLCFRVAFLPCRTVYARTYFEGIVWSPCKPV